MPHLQDLSKFSTWVLDLDGTLVDPSASLQMSWSKLREISHIVPKDFDYLSWVGTPLHAVLRELNSEEDHLGELIESFNNEMEKFSDLTIPYKEAETFIRHLSDCGSRILIFTAKPRRRASELLQRFSWKFDHLVAGDDLPEGTHKPSGKGLRVKLSEFGYSAESAVYLGDSQSDLSAATEAGIPFIWAKWGFGENLDYKHSFASLESLNRALARSKVGKDQHG